MAKPTFGVTTTLVEDQDAGWAGRLGAYSDRIDRRIALYAGVLGQMLDNTGIDAVALDAKGDDENLYCVAQLWLLTRVAIDVLGWGQGARSLTQEALQGELDNQALLLQRGARPEGVVKRVDVARRERDRDYYEDVANGGGEYRRYVSPHAPARRSKRNRWKGCL